MRLDDLNTDIRHTATVKESERITPDEADEIRNLVLEVDDGKFSFEAGQSIGVVVPGPHEFGQKEHFRLFLVMKVLVWSLRLVQALKR